MLKPDKPGRSAIASHRTLIALVIGLAGGTLLGRLAAPGLGPMLAIADPAGKLWLDALTMTIVPLIFGVLVTGIANAATSAQGSRTARRALLWFALLLTGACLFAAMLSSTALAVWPVPPEAGTLRPGTPPPVLTAPGDWIAGLIPTNPIKAAAEGAMVPLVIFAVLFGLAIPRIDTRLQAAILAVLQAIVEVMLVIVRWVLWLAPIGVLALAFGVGVRLGLSAAGALVQYVVIVSGACLSAALLAYIAAIVAGRISLRAFARAALPSQVVAVSTQSSLASLPAMMAAAPALHVSETAAGVTLPLAVSLFRAASGAANIAVAIYLAHLHGIPIGIGTIILGALVAVPISLAAVGLPAQISFFATIAPVCVAMGVPIQLLPLLLAVETIPDIFRTFGNVTADLAVLRIAGVEPKP